MRRLRLVLLLVAPRSAQTDAPAPLTPMKTRRLEK